MADRLELMRQGGIILDQALRALVEFIKPGLRLSEIDAFFESFIKQKGATAGFKTVDDWRWATCINLNHGLVHGVPSDKIRVKAGDLVTVDAGVLYRGFHTDKAVTFQLTETGVNFDLPFLRRGIKALRQAIGQVKAGASLAKISRTLESQINKGGYRIIPQLGGHGIGRRLHEEPMILQYYQPGLDYPTLKTGQTLAIEVIYTKGQPDYVTLDDGWTLEIKDKSLAAMFEETVAVTPKGYQLLTADSLGSTCLQSAG